MGAKIFVGNLSPRTTKSEIARFFSAAGRVASVSLPVDRETGEPRGFCFVEFADRDSAEEAFSVCDGRELNGRPIRVSWAREEGEGSTVRRAKWRRAWEESLEEEESDDRGFDDSRRGLGPTDHYAGRQGRRRRHGKHGSDRMRHSGTRRVIE